MSGKIISKRSLIAKIRACHRRIQVERDKLRAIVNEQEEILESYDRAEADLQSAIDALSEYL